MLTLSTTIPITVTTPTQGDAVGPGVLIEASSSLGVIPVGAHWDALVFEVDKQVVLIDAFTDTDSPAGSLILGVRKEASGQRLPVFQPIPSYPATAGEFTMVVRLVSAQSTLLDTSGPIGVQWQPDAWGTAYVQSLAPSTAVEGGFTETDRQTLLTTQASVVSALPLTTTPSGAVDLGVDLLQSGPPLEFLGVSSDIILSGRSSVDRPSGSAGIYAYGFRWFLETAPFGLGKVEGVVAEYEQRIVQWALIKGGAGGFEYIAELVEDHHGSGQMTWGIPFPKRLEFSILPFCTVRLRWLLFLQAP